MIVFLNGQFVPEDRAMVSVFDRSFLYGDGLFETIAISNGKPFRLGQHLDRLTRGAAFLGIRLPYTAEQLRDSAGQLIAANQMKSGLLRLTVSRGVGVRGYSPAGAKQPTVVMSLHPGLGEASDGRPQWALRVASFRLPANEPLSQFKTCNKLPQILARAEADAAKAQESLLLNTDGFVVEGASSNLFWIKDGTIGTPPISAGILAGVTRLVILEICGTLGLPCAEKSVTPKELLVTDGVFVSLSSVGIAEGVALDNQPLRRSPLTERIWAAYHRLLQEETSI